MTDGCKGCALLRQHHKTAWDRGYAMCKLSYEGALRHAAEALNAERRMHAETNVALTAEIMRLEAQLAAKI